MRDLSVCINSSSYCAYCALPHTQTNTHANTHISLSFARSMCTCGWVAVCRYVRAYMPMCACRFSVHVYFICFPIAHHRTICVLRNGMYDYAILMIKYTKSSLMLMPLLLLLKILYNESPLLCILCKIEWEIHHKSIMCTWGIRHEAAYDYCCCCCYWITNVYTHSARQLLHFVTYTETEPSNENSIAMATTLLPWKEKSCRSLSLCVHSSFRARKKRWQNNKKKHIEPFDTSKCDEALHKLILALALTSSTIPFLFSQHFKLCIAHCAHEYAVHMNFLKCLRIALHCHVLLYIFCFDDSRSLFDLCVSVTERVCCCCCWCVQMNGFIH